MPHSSTFLRFTTRGLLLVMVGLSVALAIAFSLLPPLLGVTRGQMAMMLGWYGLGFLIHATGVTLRRMWLNWQAGDWLLSLYPPSTQLSTRLVAIAPLAASGLYFLVARWVMESGVGSITFLIVAGVFGGSAFRFFLWGREVTALELREGGIVCDSNRFVPWGLVRVRTPHSAHSSRPYIEFYFAMKWHSFELSESAMHAVEGVLVQHKPGYADLANFE